MAACDYPQLVMKAGERSKTGKVFLNDIHVPCGKCYNCRMSRLRGWIFRLEQEDKVSSNAHFVTLTYDNENVPITNNGFMTFDKEHLVKFMKALRKKQKSKIKYYITAEYGGKTERPHYHAIMFNIENQEILFDTWKYGDVHVGTVSSASISYTLEYISQQSTVPIHERDDRLKEFSRFSKGLGKNYLSDEIIKYHKENWNLSYLVGAGGLKTPMPKYYRRHIYTDAERKRQADYIAGEVEKQYEDNLQKKGIDRIDKERAERVRKLNSRTKKNKQ